MMKIYLVGGAVRDELLQIASKDRDWVVVGATPEDMLARGFQQVGRDFPVFLHPETHEEYALARMERKTGRGHQAFQFEFSPAVTLEEDLARRDLTINAIAKDADGHLIDPFGGTCDIKRRVLRHVSPHFVEDPLRVLRVMRFWARFYALGFRVAEETRALCKQMAASGELASLTRERVWQECEKAFSYPNPEVFIQGLAEVGALCTLGIAPAPNAAQLAEQAARIKAACARSSDAAQRFAWWCGNDAALSQAISAQLPLPNHYRYWIDLVARHAATLEQFATATPEAKWALFKACGSLRAKGVMVDFARLAGLSTSEMNHLKSLHAQLLRISPQALQAQGVQGKALGEAIKRAQLAVLSAD